MYIPKTFVPEEPLLKRLIGVEGDAVSAGDSVYTAGRLWNNNSSSPILVPANADAANMVAAGFEPATSVQVDEVLLSANDATFTGIAPAGLKVGKNIANGNTFHVHTDGRWMRDAVTADGNSQFYVFERADSSTAVPTATEVPSPGFGDVADVKLADGSQIHFRFNGGWVRTRLDQFANNRYTIITRNDATTGVEPTATEHANPINSDTAKVHLTDNTEEYYEYVAGAWVLLYTVTPATVNNRYTIIDRTNDTANVAPTAAEHASPIDGDTAKVFLTNHANEYWSYSAGAWLRVTTDAIIAASDPVQTHADNTVTPEVGVINVYPAGTTAILVPAVETNQRYGVVVLNTPPLQQFYVESAGAWHLLEAAVINTLTDAQAQSTTDTTTGTINGATLNAAIEAHAHGTFTGTVIPDNSNTKDAIQALETELDALDMSGKFVGFASTFAALPTTDVLDGDFAALTTLDGTNERGLYQYDGTAYALFLSSPIVTIHDLTTAEATDPSDTTMGQVSGERLHEAITADIQAYHEVDSAFHTPKPVAADEGKVAIVDAGGNWALGDLPAIHEHTDAEIVDETNTVTGTLTPKQLSEAIDAFTETLFGVKASDANLGTFTGSTITDNASIKSALQEIETQLESQNVTGRYIGSAATFATLPTTSVATGAAQNGDWAILSAVDAANKKGVYVYDGTVYSFAFELASNTNQITDAQAIDFTNATPGILSPKQLGLAIEAYAAPILGVALSDKDLGTFTGSTIANDSTVKTALQSLETKLEGLDTGGRYIGTSTTYAGLDGGVDPIIDRDWAFLANDDIGTGSAAIPQYVRGIYANNNGTFEIVIAMPIATPDVKLPGARLVAGNRGTFVTFGTIQLGISPTGNASVRVRSATITPISARWTTWLAWNNSNHQITAATISANTGTGTYLQSAWNFTNIGEMQSAIIEDVTNGRMYEMVMVVQAAYNNCIFYMSEM